MSTMSCSSTAAYGVFVFYFVSPGIRIEDEVDQCGDLTLMVRFLVSSQGRIQGEEWGGTKAKKKKREGTGIKIYIYIYIQPNFFFFWELGGTMATTGPPPPPPNPSLFLVVFYFCFVFGLLMS
jgi:hypothetical protein